MLVEHDYGGRPTFRPTPFCPTAFRPILDEKPLDEKWAHGLRRMLRFATFFENLTLRLLLGPHIEDMMGL